MKDKVQRVVSQVWPELNVSGLCIVYETTDRTSCEWLPIVGSAEPSQDTKAQDERTAKDVEHIPWYNTRLGDAKTRHNYQRRKNYSGCATMCCNLLYTAHHCRLSEHMLSYYVYVQASTYQSKSLVT